MSDSGNAPDLREAIVPTEGTGSIPSPDLRPPDQWPPARGWCVAIAVVNILIGAVVGYFGVVLTLICLNVGGVDAAILFLLPNPVAGAAMMLSGNCLLIAGPRSLRIASWLIIAAIVCEVAYFAFLFSYAGYGAFRIPTNFDQLCSMLGRQEFRYFYGLPGLMVVIAALELLPVFKLARQ